MREGKRGAGRKREEPITSRERRLGLRDVFCRGAFMLLAKTSPLRRRCDEASSNLEGEPDRRFAGQGVAIDVRYWRNYTSGWRPCFSGG